MQYATPENFVMHENDAIINENIHNQPFVAPNSMRPSQPQQQQTPQQPSQPPPPPQQQRQQNHHVSSGVDFRRRRNWSERILNEVTGLLHVLSPVGKILHCSPSCIELTGYTPEELVGRSLTEFLHVDDIDIFIREFNRAFHTRSQIKTIYRFRKKDQSYTLFETIGHPRTDVLGQPPRSFFAIAQPYPSAMDSLFDSFLELKMENEWLKQRLREIPVDVSIDPIFNIDVASGSNSSNNSTTTVTSNNNRNINTASSGCQQPMGGYSNNNLKRRVSEENITSTSNTTNNSNPINTNSTSNGLWLREDAMVNVYPNNKNKNTPNTGNNNGSRSPVPPTASSAGGAAPAVAAVGMVSANVMDITETTASEMIKDKSKRRKKQRGADEYVCTDCGTATSPEWRKGPHGPKTLCNACGLRFAKKSKKNRS
ncbi:hypothetical protein BDC45DRAFT_505947 [Circinella umbellata]|nr:hypothetical protein BDC45DRAFT_505947 [Circinella umbellata]